MAERDVARLARNSAVTSALLVFAVDLPTALGLCEFDELDNACCIYLLTLEVMVVLQKGSKIGVNENCFFRLFRSFFLPNIPPFFRAWCGGNRTIKKARFTLTPSRREHHSFHVPNINHFGNF